MGCDAHGVCWACLSKHIEVQVLSEGKCNVRCPGEGCRYHLLSDDVDYALWGSSARDQVLDTLSRLTDQSGQDRLKDVVFGTRGDASEQWALRECQPCPSCMVLARRETGCDHIICRCGCDFCFRCGAPDDAVSGCICGYLHNRSGNADVFFAAWLRTLDTNPSRQWLWDLPENNESRSVATMGLFLWIAGAQSSPPESWNDDVDAASNIESQLPPLTWHDTWVSQSHCDATVNDCEYE